MEKCCEFCGRGIEVYARSTRKYCDDNCKQLAYYARQGMSWGKPELSSPGVLSLNVKPDFTLSDKMNVDENEFTEIEEKVTDTPTAKKPVSVKQVTEQPNETAPARLPYRWVNSSLLSAIERKRNQIEMMFIVPSHYWTQDAIPVVRWVTVRVRCLLDNIIRLSNYSSIDRLTLRQLSDGVKDLTDSCYFQSMPANYPFTELVRDLRNKFEGAVKLNTAGKISLRLSSERKAEYIAYKLMIGDFAPKRKFSELNFGDGISKRTGDKFDGGIEE